MFTLVIGGSASGKSRYAEALLQAQPGPRLYLATMRPFDAECEARIARHREERADKGFATIECYVNLKEAEIPSGSGDGEEAEATPGSSIGRHTGEA